MFRPGGSESVNSEAALPDAQYFDLLGRVATGDAKLVIANTFAANLGTSFTGRELSQTLEEYVPDGWSPNWRTISGYCHLSLAPAEIVKHVGGEGPYHSEYQSTFYGASIGLGMGGVVNNWSLANPNLSTHQIFGANNGTGSQHSAKTRFQTLSYLLDHKSEVSIKDIVDDMDNTLTYSRVGNHIASLDQSGLVEYSDKTQEHNPIFNLTEPKPRMGQIKQERTKQLYGVLRKLFDDGVEQISLQDLLERTLEASDGDIDPVILRKDLGRAAIRQKSISCLIATASPLHTRTKVSLKDEYREPIQSLFTELEEFRKTPNTSSYQKTGLEIVTDGDSVRKLFDKWERTSSKIQFAQTEGYKVSNEQIIGIISSLGTATLKDIYAEIKEQNSGLSRPRIKERVHGLVEKGILDSTTMRPDPAKKKRKEVFRIPD